MLFINGKAIVRQLRWPKAERNEQQPKMKIFRRITECTKFYKTSRGNLKRLSIGSRNRFFSVSSEEPELKHLMNYLDSLKNFEKSGVPKGAGTDSDDGFDLGRMNRLMDLLGNPHSKFKVSSFCSDLESTFSAKRFMWIVEAPEKLFWEGFDQVFSEIKFVCFFYSKALLSIGAFPKSTPIFVFDFTLKSHMNFNLLKTKHYGIDVSSLLRLVLFLQYGVHMLEAVS